MVAQGGAQVLLGGSYQKAFGRIGCSLRQKAWVNHIGSLFSLRAHIYALMRAFLQAIHLLSDWGNVSEWTRLRRQSKNCVVFSHRCELHLLPRGSNAGMAGELPTYSALGQILYPVFIAGRTTMRVPNPFALSSLFPVSFSAW